MRDEPRVLNLLGLAMRAGQVTSGDSLCERDIRAGRAALAFMDEGVSQNTREKYIQICGAKGISLEEVSADALGKAIGKPNRMIVVLAKGKLANKVASLL